MKPDGLFFCSGSGCLQAAQEVHNVLFLWFRECIEPGNHRIGFGRREVLVALARMSLDRLQQGSRSSVVQEKKPLSNTPERSGPELIRPGSTLDDVIG